MENQKESPAVTGDGLERLAEKIESGEISLNQARAITGLSPIEGADDLAAIFEGSEMSIRAMNRVFEAHKGIETVIVNPDSWVGRELLIQSKRLIDMRHDMNRLERKIDKLMKLFQEAQPLQDKPR